MSVDITTPAPPHLSHNTHRELEILDQLRLSGGSCRIQFLADRLQVTEQTVRRNVRRLEDNGTVKKVHGGVHLVDVLTEAPFQQRMSVNSHAKRIIAASVADMITDGDSLFLDIGSTTAYIAMALQNHRDLFVVTNSVAVAHALATRNNNRVYLAGGALRPHDGGAFGKTAIDFIHQFNFQFAVLSVGAINAEDGFMLHDLQEAQVSREAIARAHTTIVAGDSGKFGHRAPIIVAEPDEFDVIVTDKKPAIALTNWFRDKDIDLVLAGDYTSCS